MHGRHLFVHSPSDGLEEALDGVTQRSLLGSIGGHVRHPAAHGLGGARLGQLLRLQTRQWIVDDSLR